MADTSGTSGILELSAEETSPRIKEIGGFELITRVGRGGMGAVFKARQKSLDRIVALKVLPPSIAQNKKLIERFQREARASARLTHPNIVQGIDVGQDPASGLWFFAMEFIDGPTLRQVLKEEKVMGETRALDLVRQIARALDHVAGVGMVHRDIKPDNIILNSRGIPKLADLGLAKQITDDASLTQAGQAIGTPNYMAPEQVRGAEEEIDIRTDLYALGATLFHLVTGETPFSGPTSAVILSKHLTETPRLAHKVNPQVSEACGKLIARLLEKKREQRIQSPAELVTQIERILNKEKTTSAARPPISKGQSGMRPAVGKGQSGMRPAVGRVTTGPRIAIGKGTSGYRRAVDTGSTGPLPPAGYRTSDTSSTGPLSAATSGPRSAVGKSTSGPREAIDTAPTGSMPPLTTGPRVPLGKGTSGMRRAIDTAPTGTAAPATMGVRVQAAAISGERAAVAAKSARSNGQMLWIAIGIGGVLVVGFAALVFSTREPAAQKTATPPPALPRPVAARPAPPPPPVVSLPSRDERAQNALDDALELQKKNATDFTSLLPAFERMREQTRNTAVAAKADEALAAVQTRATEALDAVIKPAEAAVAAALAKNDFAAAREAVKDDVVPAGLRIGEWKPRLGALGKTVDAAAETAATKVLDEARTRAQPGDVPALEAALAQLKQLDGIPAVAAQAKAAEERAKWTAAIVELRKAELSAQQALAEKARAIVTATQAELAPLLQQNRFAAAGEVLEKKLRDKSLAAAETQLKQEKADLAALLALRQSAIGALRKLEGKAVRLKKGNGALAGTVKDEPSRPYLNLKLAEGPEISVAAEQLDVSDVDAYAPADEAALPEDQRRRGLLYLAAGDTGKAKEFFQKAQAGLGAAIAPYLERIELLELGEFEIRARKDWAAAEALYAGKQWKEAQLAYVAFQAQHAKTKALALAAAQLKERLQALDEMLNPLRPGLVASFFRNREFKTEDAALTRIDAKVDYDWGGGSPAPEVPADNFCGRWTGFVKIAKAGHYTFATLTDDGGRLWVDGKPMVDQWHDQGPTRHAGEIDLTEGPHEIKLEYFENGGGATCRLLWSLKDGFAEMPIPPEALWHDPRQTPAPPAAPPEKR